MTCTSTSSLYADVLMSDDFHPQESNITVSNDLLLAHTIFGL